MTLAIAALALSLAGTSISRDIRTYSWRQDQWEHDHPGATYVRGWKKMSAQERATYS